MANKEEKQSILEKLRPELKEVFDIVSEYATLEGLVLAVELDGELLAVKKKYSEHNIAQVFNVMVKDKKYYMVNIYDPRYMTIADNNIAKPIKARGNDVLFINRSVNAIVYDTREQKGSVSSEENK